MTINLIFKNVGAAIKNKYERTKREAEIENTNWVLLADKWMEAKGRIEDRFVTLLPSSGKIRESEPEIATIINGTKMEDLKRVIKKKNFISFMSIVYLHFNNCTISFFFN